MSEIANTLPEEAKMLIEDLGLVEISAERL